MDIISAAKANDSLAVKKALERGEDPNAVYTYNGNPL